MVLHTRKQITAKQVQGWFGSADLFFKSAAINSENNSGLRNIEFGRSYKRGKSAVYCLTKSAAESLECEIHRYPLWRVDNSFPPRNGDLGVSGAASTFRPSPPFIH